MSSRLLKPIVKNYSSVRIAKIDATPPVRLTLDKVVVPVIQLPLRRPIVARLGEFMHLRFILTDVLTKQGVIGHSYLAPYRAAATKSIVALIEVMAEQRRGKPVAPFDRFEGAMRSLHLLGRQGVMLVASAALDMAVWDALAKALGLPLARTGWNAWTAVIRSWRGAISESATARFTSQTG